MNYLMHLYLSGDDEQIMTGNFMADSIKGNKVNDYPTSVTVGILLHRKIDDFSDNHADVCKSKERFRPVYGKYAGVAVDIIYDHFLAADFQRYSSADLNDYVSHCHKILLKNWSILPWDVKLFLPFLIKHKRLQSYATPKGLSNALSVMARKTSFPERTNEAMDILMNDYNLFCCQFNSFFSDISAFALNELNRLISVADS